MKWVLGLALLICGIGVEVVRGADVLPSYFYTDFEADSGWHEGAWSGSETALRLTQGSAAIVLEDAPFGQVAELPASEPIATLSIATTPVQRAATIHAEFWARPPVSSVESGTEFFNLGGAVLGFFRVGEGEGEVYAMHGGGDRDNMWISTGVRVPLDGNGTAANWAQFGIRLRRDEQRWDLLIDGGKVLAGLRTVSLAGNDPLPFWFFGDATHPMRLDGIFLSSVAPEVMEKLQAGRAQRIARRQANPRKIPHPQIVTRVKPTKELRKAAQPALTQGQAPALRGWRLTLETGGRTYESPRPDPKADPTVPGIIAYAPGYDDDGKPLPLKIRITADAELKPGVDLSKLRWQVAEWIGWPDKLGKVLQSGNFRTGLVQEVVSPPEDARKATSVGVWIVP